MINKDLIIVVGGMTMEI